MPNWCNNTLVVRGEKEDMAKFNKVIEKKRNSDKKLEDILKAFIPIPKDIKDDWYNWCIENWGTKWDILCYDDRVEEDYTEFSFDRAWGPPIAWLEIVAKKYPKLKFSLKYDEPGMCFMGCAKGSNGKIETETIEYWEE